jgi:two-component system, response regulator PdtaR
MAEPRRPLRVAVADDEPDTLEFFRELLTLLGHYVVVAAPTGRDLVEGCRQMEPDLVLTDIKMPDMDGIAAAETINRGCPAPVVLVSAHDDPEFLRRAEAAGPVMAYLLKPVRAPDVAAAVCLAVARFAERQQALRALEERKLVERAKGALMKRLGVDEDEAYRRLWKYANDQNVNVTEVAGLVLRAEEVFRTMEGVNLSGQCSGGNGPSRWGASGVSASGPCAALTPPAG